MPTVNNLTNSMHDQSINNQHNPKQWKEHMDVSDEVENFWRVLQKKNHSSDNQSHRKFLL